MWKSMLHSIFPGQLCSRQWSHTDTGFFLSSVGVFQCPWGSGFTPHTHSWTVKQQNHACLLGVAGGLSEIMNINCATHNKCPSSPSRSYQDEGFFFSWSFFLNYNRFLFSYQEESSAFHNLQGPMGFGTLESRVRRAGGAKVLLWTMPRGPAHWASLEGWDCVRLLFTLTPLFTSLENANGPGTLTDYMGMLISKSFIFIDSVDITHLGCMKSNFPVDHKLISFMKLHKDASFFFFVTDDWSVRLSYLKKKTYCLRHLYLKMSSYFNCIVKCIYVYCKYLESFCEFLAYV